jgi:hypothetical protein
MIGRFERYRSGTARLEELERKEKDEKLQAKLKTRSLLYRIDTVMEPFKAQAFFALNVDEFLKDMVRPSKLRQFRPIKATSLSNGYVISHTFAGSLENKAQILAVEKGKDVVYERYPIEVDAQAIGSTAIKLTGIEEMAQDPSIYEDLRELCGALTVEVNNSYKSL